MNDFHVIEFEKYDFETRLPVINIEGVTTPKNIKTNLAAYRNILLVNVVFTIREETCMQWLTIVRIEGATDEGFPGNIK